MKHIESTVDKTALVKAHLPKAMSYEAYIALVAQKAAENSHTGPTPSESLAQYTQLNDARMRRLTKTTKLSSAIENTFKNFKGKQTWIVLTESWCGDAAQTMPAMKKLADLTPNIEIKVLLRDENLALMDAYLTNGSRSIPKLIVLDEVLQEATHSWGPRPSKAAQMAADYKRVHGKLTPEFKKDLQVWYNKDKAQNTLEDLAQLIH